MKQSEENYQPDGESKNKNEKEEADVEKRPISVIADIHQSFEYKITKRREEASNDMKNYCDSIDKINKRIENLSKAFSQEIDE